MPAASRSTKAWGPSAWSSGSPNETRSGAFFSLALAETVKSPIHIVTLLSSAGVMGLCLLGAKYFKKPWLREWGLGIAILVALVIAYLVTAK